MRRPGNLKQQYLDIRLAISQRQNVKVIAVFLQLPVQYILQRQQLDQQVYSQWRISLGKPLPKGHSRLRDHHGHCSRRHPCLLRPLPQNDAGRQSDVRLVSRRPFRHAIVSTQLLYSSPCAFLDPQPILTACDKHSTSTFNFINIILNEECLSVQQVYLIFNVIFSSLRYLADVLLLATTFTYLIPRSILTRHATQNSRNLGSTLLHLLFCGLLGLFWLVITVILLAVVIQQVRDTGIVGNFDLINGVRKLDFTYNLLYLFAALEIVALAVMKLTSRAKDPNGSNEPTNSKRVCELVDHPIHLDPSLTTNIQQPLLFLILIALPLLIRSVWQLAIAARYELEYSISVGLEREQLRLAQMLFYCLCTTLIYIGLALVIKQLGAETPFTNAMQETEEEKGKAGLGPEIPIMRAAPAPTPKLRPFDPYAAPENSRSSRLSRDHSEDPIYNGP